MSDTKICPLFAMAVKMGMHPANSGVTQCLEDACSWWIKYTGKMEGYGSCAVQSIALDMPDKS
jgi:hypothetical protein